MAIDTKEKELPYPKSVFFIVSNEFCERFSYYGMRTILSLYLVKILLYSESDAKIIYHTFTMFAYFFPIFGAILSDSFLGKFRTIFYVSILYAIGNIVLALSSVEPIGLPQRPFSILGLLLIAFGTGGIKPCVSAFGGDQFVLPQQAIQLAAFFSMFYFAINAGSFISTFLTPVLRENVHCFNSDNCYPLAFGVPGILMIISIVIFALGKPLYKIKAPEGNIIVRVSKCIAFAIKQKYKTKEIREHWLDHSEEKFGKKLVNDIKILLKVLVLYVPLPIFWALFDQQGTGWTFQAVRMNGDIGFYTILPDQMQVVNPLLILVLIPLFTYVVYPALSKINLLRSPLQRMVCGGLLAAIAFGISACISLFLEKTYPVLPTAGNAQLRFYNTLNCNLTIDSGVFGGKQIIPNMGYRKFIVNLEGNNTYTYTLSDCPEYKGPTQGTLNINELQTIGYFLNENALNEYQDDITKSEDGYPRIRTLVSHPDSAFLVNYIQDSEVKLEINSTDDGIYGLSGSGIFKIEGSDEELQFGLGGVYTILINLNGNRVNDVRFVEITPPNSVHILWLLPQYVIITTAEIMFSITGLEFSYSQAPSSMKSVLQAAFLLTTAIGNLLIVVIESARIFEDQSSDFFLYAALMALDMIIFAFMAMKYKYIEKSDENTENSTTECDGDDGAKKTNGVDNLAFSGSKEFA